MSVTARELLDIKRTNLIFHGVPLKPRFLVETKEKYLRFSRRKWESVCPQTRLDNLKDLHNLLIRTLFFPTNHELTGKHKKKMIRTAEELQDTSSGLVLALAIVHQCPPALTTAYFMLNVPHDAPNGHEVVFEGKSDGSPDWEPGDVILYPVV